MPYIRNRKIFDCPQTWDTVWKIPDGEVDLKKNRTAYIFNAWYLKRPGSTNPRDRVEVAGQKESTCASPADAPLVWDGVSGYEQLAHEDSINVLCVDGHVKSVTIDPEKPPYNRTKGMEAHFWGAPGSDSALNVTGLARAWWYGIPGEPAAEEE